MRLLPTKPLESDPGNVPTLLWPFGPFAPSPRPVVPTSRFDSLLLFRSCHNKVVDPCVEVYALGGCYPVCMCGCVLPLCLYPSVMSC